MLNFDKQYSIRNVLERIVTEDDLITAVFNDISELQEFTFSKTNEYDDNNYSDYSRLTKVNGHPVNCDGEYEEDLVEQDDTSERHEVSERAVDEAMNLAEFVKEKYGHGEHEFKRADYKGRSDGLVRGTANMECAVAVLNKKAVPLSTLLEAYSEWILHYADAHGRYGDDEEFALFAREDMMGMALAYAKRFGPLADKTLNYFILSVNSEDHGHDHLQEYLKWLKKVA